METHPGGGKGWNAGIAEQFTHFKTLQIDGREISNSARQRLDSSITQVALGYNFSDRCGLQINVPFIYRDFRRPEEGHGMRSDQTAGVGDLSVVGNFVALRHESDKTGFTWTLTAGVKFPTGSTRRLREETEEGHHHGEEEAVVETITRGKRIITQNPLTGEWIMVARKLSRNPRRKSSPRAAFTGTT